MKGFDYALWSEYGEFDYNKSAGIELSLHAVKNNMKFEQVNVNGIAREDSQDMDKAFVLTFA